MRSLIEMTVSLPCKLVEDTSHIARLPVMYRLYYILVLAFRVNMVCIVLRLIRNVLFNAVIWSIVMAIMIIVIS